MRCYISWCKGFSYHLKVRSVGNSSQGFTPRRPQGAGPRSCVTARFVLLSAAFCAVRDYQCLYFILQSSGLFSSLLGLVFVSVLKIQHCGQEMAPPCLLLLLPLVRPLKLLLWQLRPLSTAHCAPCTSCTWGALSLFRDIADFCLLTK